MPTHPDPIDVHLGDRVKARREELKLTASEIARQLDISRQMLFKHEKGVSTMPHSRLLKVAKILKRPIGWFYAGLKDDHDV